MSAAAPVLDALWQALRADAALQTALGATPTDRKVYGGAADSGAAYPYITLPDAAESPRGRAASFGAAGYDGGTTLHLWVGGTDLYPVLTLWGHVERVLDGATLTVTGHQAIAVRATLVRTYLDPDKAVYHGVVNVRTLTRKVA